MKSPLHFFRSHARSQKGIALLMSLFAMTLMTLIALEVSYDTSVDYVVAAQQINRIKAHYAAKSGLELSLLRIMLYKQVMAAVGEQLGPNKSMLDPIWNFPFLWPPTIAAGMMETDKSLMEDAVGESLMQAQYVTTISPEGGRLDINDLGSESKSLRDSIRGQIVKIFEAEVQNNEAFRKKYGSFRFEELVNNIADYVDEDQEGLNGGDERSQYRDVQFSGLNSSLELPPNRSLKTIEELHQVAKMNDDFYNVLAPKVTIYGTKGANVNYAGADLLKALDPSVTDDAVGKIMSRRSDPKLGGPFQSDEDFFGFARQYGVNVQAIQDSKIPLLYDMEFNFRITSTGIAGNVKKEITVITYDFANLKYRLADILDKSDIDLGRVPPPQNPQKDSDKKKAKIEATKGRPIVVYYEEN